MHPRAYAFVVWSEPVRADKGEGGFVWKKCEAAQAASFMALNAVSSAQAFLSRTKPSIAAANERHFTATSFLPSPKLTALRGTGSVSPRTVKAFPRRVSVTCSASGSNVPAALLFDCDGVLVDTEKDGHRISFNDTFQEVIYPPPPLPVSGFIFVFMLLFRRTRLPISGFSNVCVTLD